MQSSKTKKWHGALIGHRGGGKTTELKRLANGLTDRFLPVIITIDPSLENDADYPEVFLWIITQLIETLKDSDITPPAHEFKQFVEWFAEVTKEKTDTTTSTTTAETKAEAKVGGGFLVWAFSIAASLKSAISGSTQHRSNSREEVKKYLSELQSRTNGVLAAADEALKKKHPGKRILLIVDNLDRLQTEAARSLFCDNGQILTSLQSIVLFVAPVGMVLGGRIIYSGIRPHFMPMISVRDRRGKKVAAAVNGLTDLLSARLDIASCFEAPALVTDLVLASGGSIRSLLRLTDEAVLEAMTRDSLKIQSKDIDRAIKEQSLTYQRAYALSSVYYDILAEVDARGTLAVPEASADGTSAEDSRLAFWRRLLHDGALLEYNGESTWYGIHPPARECPQFREAAARLKKPKPKPVIRRPRGGKKS